MGRPIRALILDVDGVLTDGGMYYGPKGETLKKFNVKDGMGIRLVREAGIAVALVTGERSEAVLRRAEKLKIRDVFLGVEDKGRVVRKFLAARGIRPEEAAYVGDDVNDLPALRLVGLAFAVADAVPSVRKAVDRITTRRGGEGAVREVCDFLLKSRAPADR
ncbi:MAG TPA: HAD-IIIA family hydrolase [Planctomycetota bacterium]|nr:HAD-IIIA family hydrolase [Planctomycetota bacterium]